jgi:membrane protein DedA with SNARE-associated domain
VTPVARSFVSIPAGVLEARLPRYTVLTFIGSTLWCIGFAAAGYVLGTRWERFHDSFRYVDYVVGALVVAAAVWLLLRRRGRAAEETA